MKFHLLRPLLFAGCLAAAANASAYTTAMELGPPPALPNTVSDVAPQTGEDPSPLPGGFIPGVSKLYGPILRGTDLSLGTGGTGGSIAAPAVVTPTRLDVVASDGLSEVSVAANSGFLQNVGLGTNAVPETGSSFLLLALSLLGLLASKKLAKA